MSEISYYQRVFDITEGEVLKYTTDLNIVKYAIIKSIVLDGLNLMINIFGELGGIRVHVSFDTMITSFKIFPIELPGVGVVEKVIDPRELIIANLSLSC